MPKYEIEPGRYGFKKPRPIDREGTAKEYILEDDITDADLRMAESRASIEVAGQWIRNRPEDFRTLENCDECLEKLTDTVWQTDEQDEIFEPAFEACDEHPELVRDWIYDQLEAMFDHLQ